MQIVDSIGVRVFPHMEGFRRELDTNLKRIDTDLKVDMDVRVDTRAAAAQMQLFRESMSSFQINQSVRLDTDQATGALDRLSKIDIGGGRASRQIRDLTDSLGGLAIGSRDTAKSVASFGLSATGSVLRVAALTSAAASAAGTLGSLSGALAATLPALAVLPGAAVAGGLAIATLTVGMQGFGEALKNLGDPEKFAKALENLAPAAQDAARAFADLRQPFEDVRKAVQGRLFEGFGKEIRALGDQYLPVLRRGMVDLAGTFNTAGHEFTAFLSNADTVGDVANAFRTTRRAVDNLVEGIQPVLSGLRDIGMVGIKMLPDLTAGFDSAAQSFADWAATARETGQLRELILGAFDAIGKVVDIIGNLASAVYSVFSAASDAGADFLSNLAEITQQFADFLKSTEGASLLTSVFGALRQIMDGLRPVFGEIVEAVVDHLIPAVVSLAPVIGSVFAALAPAIEPIAQALTALAPVIGVIATALVGVLRPAIEALSPVIAQLAPVVGELATFFGEVLAAAIRTVAPILGPLAEIISTVLLTALDALRPVLPVVAEAFRQVAEVIGGVLREAAPVLGEVAAIMAGALADALTTIAPYLPQIAGAFGEVLIAVLPLLPEMARLAAEIMPQLLETLPAILPSLVEMARAWTEILVAITPLIPLLVDTLVPAFSAVIATVTRVVTTVVSAAAGMAKAVSGVVQLVTGLLTGDFSRAWEGAKSAVSGAIQFIGGILRMAFELFTAPIRIAVDAILAIFRNAGGSWGGAIRNVINGIPAILGNVGSLLLNAGRSLIQGFIDGIKAMAGRAVQTAKDVVSAIRDFFPFSPAKRGPFSGTGYTLYSGRALAEDFAKGITQRAGLATEAVSGLMAAAEMPTAGLSGGEWSAALDRSLSVDAGGAGAIMAEAVRKGLAEATIAQDATGQFRVVQKSGIEFNRR